MVLQLPVISLQCSIYVTRLLYFILVGGSNTYAVLICGNDSNSLVNAAVFKRDLFELENILTDSRIIGVRLIALELMSDNSEF